MQRKDFRGPSLVPLPRLRFLPGRAVGASGGEHTSRGPLDVATAVLANARPGGDTAVVDYACGVGRIARAIVQCDPEARVTGVEASEVQRQLARVYVGNERFAAVRPRDLTGVADVVYADGVLLRSDLERIYFHLAADGALVCSYELGYDEGDDEGEAPLTRMRREVDALFDPVGPLFDDLAPSPSSPSLSVPFVYRRKPLARFV